MTQPVSNKSELLGLVWVTCPYPVVATGLGQALKEARVHIGQDAPEDAPSSVIYCASGGEGLSEGLERIRKFSPDASILVFSFRLDLALASAALRAGAQGFIHAGMDPEQIARSVEVAARGEIVAPRKLLEFLIGNDQPADLGALTPRQRDTLKLVAEGLSNAEIARRLLLSEATVKHHLHAAYKSLGVSNRIQAAKLVRNGMREGG